MLNFLPDTTANQNSKLSFPAFISFFLTFFFPGQKQRAEVTTKRTAKLLVKPAKLPTTCFSAGHLRNGPKGRGRPFPQAARSHSVRAGPGGFPAGAALAPSAARSATSRTARCLRAPPRSWLCYTADTGDSLPPLARKEQQLAPLLLGSPILLSACSLPGAAGLSIRLDTSVFW